MKTAGQDLRNSFSVITGSEREFNSMSTSSKHPFLLSQLVKNDTELKCNSKEITSHGDWNWS